MSKKETTELANNKELMTMVAQDQQARNSGEDIPFEPMGEKHRKRVMELLDNVLES